MLVGAYPFEDPENPRDVKKTISVLLKSYDKSFTIFLCHIFIPFSDTQRILSVQYSIPDHIEISEECRHLMSGIFVANPEQVSGIFKNS